MAEAAPPCVPNLAPNVDGKTVMTPTATILLLGSGELGREFVISAKRLGCRVIACDSYEGAPAMQVADDFEVFSMLDGDALRATIEKHRKHFIAVGDLHRGRAFIAVARDHPAPQPLRRNHKFAPEFARTEEKDGGGGGHAKTFHRRWAQDSGRIAARPPP